MIRAIVNSGRLEYALTHLSDEFYPYFYAGLRRAAAAYRREFVQSLGTKLKNPQKFKSQRWPWGFKWEASPRNEKSGSIDRIAVSIGTTSKAAESLEFGATIRPRRGRMLAIPIARALTAAGRARKGFESPKAAKEAGHRIISRWRPRGEYLLGIAETRTLKRGDKTRMRLMWKLVHQVRIKARLGFYAGWEQFQPQARRRMDEEVDKFWRVYFGQRARRSA